MLAVSPRDSAQTEPAGPGVRIRRVPRRRAENADPDLPGRDGQDSLSQKQKHLGKKPEFISPPPPIEEKPSTPDVVMPEIQPVQQTQSFQKEVPTVSYSKQKNQKIMLGIGGLALVIIIAAAVSFSGITDSTGKIDTPINNIPASLSIQTDLSSYNSKDLISISGISDTTGTVNLSIENQDGELVWAEQTSLKSDGQFSTLAIAGGTGWENSGTYTIKVDNGKETKSDTFSFNS